MKLERQQQLDRLDDHHVDVLVIGGGINGAVATAALAGSGVSVALVDAADFAGGVSSQSSNLAWGGIKYLESGEFGLVRKLCRSRNRLMDAYPTMVREIRFFTSIRRGFRFWPIVVWCGAMLYWLMGGCRLGLPRYLRRGQIAEEAPEVDIDEVIGGLEYSDCYLIENDARFVFRFIRQAMDVGAIAVNYLGVDRMEWHEDCAHWRVQLGDRTGAGERHITARAIVNAAGPAVDQINRRVSATTEHRHVLSKGIHLIVNRIGSVERVLTFFASDGRLFFVIPMGNKTCIGTTDTSVDSDLIAVTDADRNFVLANANELLALDDPLTVDDIIAERVGVRPLAVAGDTGGRDWVQLSRRHEIEVDETLRLVSVFGGKLTDCLNVGEEIVARLAALGICGEPLDQAWFGEPDVSRYANFMAQAATLAIDEKTPAGADMPLSQVLWRRYGNDAVSVLDRIREDHSSLKPLFPGVALIRAEVDLILEREMVVTTDDLLRRRTMVALLLDAETVAASDGLSYLRSKLFGALSWSDTAA